MFLRLLLFCLCLSHTRTSFPFSAFNKSPKEKKTKSILSISPLSQFQNYQHQTNKQNFKQHRHFSSTPHLIISQFRAISKKKKKNQDLKDFFTIISLFFLFLLNETKAVPRPMLPNNKEGTQNCCLGARQIFRHPSAAWCRILLHSNACDTCSPR